MGKIIFTSGVIVLVIGLSGIPTITGLLSALLNLLFHDPHAYYRIVPTGSIHVPVLLAVAGLSLCCAGFVFHRQGKWK